MEQTKNTKQVMLMAILGMALMLSAMSFVMAEDNSSNVSDAIALYNDTSNLSEGIVISPAPIQDELNETEDVSSGKIGWEQLKIMLTFNQEKKAEMELKLAELRLIQARHAAKNNNTEAMQKAMDAHDRIIQRIQDRVQKMESKNDANSTRERLGGLVGLERAIQVHEEKVAKLGELLNNSNLTEDQRSKIEERMLRAQNNTNHLQEIEVEKSDKLKTKLMAVANLTEEQAQAAIDAIRDSKNKEELKQNVQDIREQAREQRQQNRPNKSD